MRARANFTLKRMQNFRGISTMRHTRHVRFIFTLNQPRVFDSQLAIARIQEAAGFDKWRSQVVPHGHSLPHRLNLLLPFYIWLQELRIQ